MYYIKESRELRRQKERTAIDDGKELTFNQLPPSGIKLRPRIPCKDVVIDIAL